MCQYYQKFRNCRLFDLFPRFPLFQSFSWFHHVLAKMLIKVKTLTGKEIEIDIEPTDKVERIKVGFLFGNNVDLARHHIIWLSTRNVWKRRKASLLHNNDSSSLVNHYPTLLVVFCCAIAVMWWCCAAGCYLLLLGCCLLVAPWGLPFIAAFL